MSKTDLAWLAGFLDGDGCFMVCKAKNSLRPVISITSTSASTLKDISDILTRHKISSGICLQRSATAFSSRSLMLRISTAARVKRLIELVSPFLKTKARVAGLLWQLADSRVNRVYKPINDRESELSQKISEENRVGVKTFSMPVEGPVRKGKIKYRKKPGAPEGNLNRLVHGLRQRPIKFATEAERELFEKKFREYMRHWRFSAPNDIDILKLGLWSLVKTNTAMDLLSSARGEAKRKAAGYYRELFGIYMTCMTKLGLTYTAQVRLPGEKVDTIDIGKLIPGIREATNKASKKFRRIRGT